MHWQWATDVAHAADNTDGWEAPEKHRSCSATPHLFSVRAEAKRGPADAAGHGGSLTDDHGVDTSDEETEIDIDRLQISGGGAGGAAPATGEEAAAEAPQQPAEDAPVAAGGPQARASLLNMFSRRPEKAVFSGLVDGADESVSTAAPGSVSIEGCVRTRFSVNNKISQLQLLNCEDVEVTFRGVISAVELIHCRRCTLRCTQAAQTYSLDDAESCSFFFPGRQERVMFVSSENSARNVLTAQPGQQALPQPDGAAAADEEKEPADIEHEVRFVIEPPAAAVVAEDTPAPTPSEPSLEPQDASAAAAAGAGGAAGSSALKQYQTIWQNGAFATQVLARQGITGYFANN